VGHLAPDDDVILIAPTSAERRITRVVGCSFLVSCVALVLLMAAANTTLAFFVMVCIWVVLLGLYWALKSKVGVTATVRDDILTVHHWRSQRIDLGSLSFVRARTHLMSGGVQGVRLTLRDRDGGSARVWLWRQHGTALLPIVCKGAATQNVSLDERTTRALG
jgi:hypothetical protein